MSNTYRKDRNGNTFKESLKKREAHYKCRCEYCTGASKNLTCDKILEKELKKQLKLDEYNFKQSGEYIEDVDDPYFLAKNRK